MNDNLTTEQHLDKAAEYASFMGIPNKHTDAHIRAAQITQLSLSRTQRHPNLETKPTLKQRSVLLIAFLMTLGIITLFLGVMYFIGVN